MPLVLLNGKSCSRYRYLALPTIVAGINQCIMLSLSMVVIAAMIGAGGLGNEVLAGISRLDIAKDSKGVWPLSWPSF